MDTPKILAVLISIIGRLVNKAANVDGTLRKSEHLIPHTVDEPQEQDLYQ
jgi:hypothetical protein